MDYETRFNEISSFLREHQYLFQNEMLINFDSPIPEPYLSWIEEISQLDFPDLYKLENEFDTSLIKDAGLKKFIQKSKELSLIPQFFPKQIKLVGELSRKMNEKKRHEIELLNGLLKDIKGIDTLIDIGSGAGHLSTAILFENKTLNSFCLDLDSNFQKMGEEKLKRWAPEILCRLKFIPLEIRPETIFPFEYNNFSSLLIGLHSCGPLSTYLVQMDFEHVLNFGCCYHKMKDEYNISKLALKNPLWFTNDALTLAAKNKLNPGMKSYEQKIRVKKYRYSLHQFMKKDNVQFATLGNAKASDYQGPFSHYAHKYYDQSRFYDESTLNSFYKENLNRILKIIKSGSLRALTGRLIELYILLDRVIYSNERGFRSDLRALFSHEISPRNIAIISNHILSTHS